MEFRLFNAAEVKQVVHGSINASPNSREWTLYDFLTHQREAEKYLRAGR